MSSGQSFRAGHGFVVVSAGGRFSGSMGDSGGSVSNRRRFGEASSGAGVSVAVVLAGSWSVANSMSWLVVMMNLTRRSFETGNISCVGLLRRTFGCSPILFEKQYTEN